MDIFSTSSILSFFAGLALGFVLGRLTQYALCDKHNKLCKKEAGAWAVIILVSFLYAVSVVFDIVRETYQTPFALHGIMGLAVGYALEAKFSEVVSAIRK